MNELREAVRFAEEYGFREWLKAQDQLNAVETAARAVLQTWEDDTEWRGRMDTFETAMEALEKATGWTPR